MLLDDKAEAALAEPASRCATISPDVAQETGVPSIPMLA
jgi:hypothetical protein